MVDMGSIAAALGGMKTAGDIAKTLLQLKSESERQAKVIELQSVIMAAQSSAISAQSDQFAMLEEVRALKEEIAQVKAWEAEKERYQLVNPLTGGSLYAVKKTMCNGEPPHYICANCYEQGKRSILQDTRDRKNYDTYLACPACNTEMPTGYRGFPERKYAEDVPKNPQMTP